jgi:hypothetical protein
MDPVTGPISRETLKELASLPYGAARAVIQKHDPLWGRQEGELITFAVKAAGTMYGTAYVKAKTPEEADELADKLGVNDFDWDDGSDGFDILSVEPSGK